MVRFHLLSTFLFQELDQVALASHRGRSAERASRSVAIQSPWLLGHILRTARSSVHSLAGKSGGRILWWRRPCVPWLDLSVHRRALEAWSPGLAGRSFVAHGSAAAAALRPPAAFVGGCHGFDYWVPWPGFPYCGTTVMVVPRAGLTRCPSRAVPSDRHGHGPAGFQ